LWAELSIFVFADHDSSTVRVLAGTHRYGAISELETVGNIRRSGSSFTSFILMNNAMQQC
jgi:hypothetical protein